MKSGKFNVFRKLTIPEWYRISVCSFYFVQGLVFASWASRIPDIKQALQLNDAALGGLLFIIPMGQMAAMALSGYLVSKYGSRPMVWIATMCYASSLVGLGASVTVWQLSVALFFFGMSANLCNISVNTQGVGVERLYGRSIMASFHGLWSLAGFIGGLISTLMVGMNVTPLWHFWMIFGLSLLTVVTMGRSILPHDPQQRSSTGERKPIFTKPDRLIILLGVITFGSMICEGTMFDWSSVYFEQVIEPPKELVRLGYIAAMCSMAAGRFMADRLVMKFGVVTVLRCSGIIIAVGLLTAVLFPHLTTATIGFLFVGLGVSSIVPLCYSIAGRSKKMLPGVALATVSTISFFGFLLGPPLIGFVSHALNLRWALGLIAFVGLIATVVAPYLKTDREETVESGDGKL